ncbi:nucleoside hydrolase [Sansalvadorimonas sp. 2012CJ34-2]|uniref:Nucleoside hydrolase n=1 Tax=Parendozoicomonas callyspongiae TaxID=2942213 RepID=A0ABT0PJJ0_9GAMM|nr:nucleoside hydrolase [Sansalvadorimonas sp. 2012CJ34-2]MCL6271533.1 nucleoside hydrolase [Sansalvadorimonas sp. 2012CJ34-2]
MPTPIILDCDPGHDDAVAILMAVASPLIELRAVTTVAGNQTLDKVHYNALRVLTLANAQVPVAAGACTPLSKVLVTAGYVHGESGIEGAELPKPAFAAETCSAVELIAKTVKESDGLITLVPTGPLTNIATFLLAYPDLKSRIKQIVLMGGGQYGNITPSAEFNIFVDPDAAKIVFQSGIPIVMCGLDVTHKAYLTREDADHIRKLNKVGETLGGFYDFYTGYYGQHNKQCPGAPMHDPCTIAWLIDPNLFTGRQCHVDVETHGQLTEGMTVVDFFGVTDKTANAEFIYDVDRQGFVDQLFELLKYYS